ncbi:MAG: hypothetical protein Q9169_004275 [Polycauliona sp. 2 TL-2023]
MDATATPSTENPVTDTILRGVDFVDDRQRAVDLLYQERAFYVSNEPDHLTGFADMIGPVQFHNIWDMQTVICIRPVRLDAPCDDLFGWQILVSTLASMTGLRTLHVHFEYRLCTQDTHAKHERHEIIRRWLEPLWGLSGLRKVTLTVKIWVMDFGWYTKDNKIDLSAQTMAYMAKIREVAQLPRR